jgi:uncharacterized protein (DUF1697 family)
MSVYVAMLRGVNVGAHNRIKMPALAQLFSDIGHTDVVTYIQSGNVVFKSRAGAAAVTRTIEQRIADDLGCDVAVLLRTKDELARIVRTNPFLGKHNDPAQLHVTFLAEKPAATLVRAVNEYDAGNDAFVVQGRDVFLHTPGGYGKTKINNGFFEQRLKAVATTRNWKSVTKLLELAS